MTPARSADSARSSSGVYADEAGGDGRPPAWTDDFTDLTHERRRLFAELFGTFLLVLVAAGGGVVGAQSGMPGRSGVVVAPGLLVMAVILAFGKISGAHLNPVVTVAFSLRGDFQWRRVPGYVAAQTLGGVAAAVLLRLMFGTVGDLGATRPHDGFTVAQVGVLEIVLTAGLVTTILGTASAAQNVGPLAAVGVGGYIALAGLWAAPVGDASMNPVRSLAPDLVRGQLAGIWPYLVGPFIGALIAVGFAHVMRDRVVTRRRAQRLREAMGANPSRRTPGPLGASGLRAIGAGIRTQAVLWGIHHAFIPATTGFTNGSPASSRQGASWSGAKAPVSSAERFEDQSRHHGGEGADQDI